MAEKKPKEKPAEESKTAVQVFMDEIDNPLVPYGQRAALKEFTRRIMVNDKGKIKLNLAEAIQVAQVAISTNANPFTAELYHWLSIRNGERLLTIYHGRQYDQRIADEWAEERGTSLDIWFELIVNVEEKALLGIAEDSMAYRCHIREQEAMRTYTQGLTDLMKEGVSEKRAVELMGEPPIAKGIGVVTAWEKKKFDERGDTKFPHANRCQKRAKREALRNLIAFRRPPPQKISMEGFVKLDWSPPKLKAVADQDAIVDAEFRDADVNGEGEYTNVTIESIDESMAGLQEQVEQYREQIKQDAKEAEQAVPINRRPSKKEMEARRKVGYWPIELLDYLVEKELAQSRYIAAGKLAYNPHPKKINPKDKQLMKATVTWFKHYVEIKESGEPHSNWSAADEATNRWLGLSK